MSHNLEAELQKCVEDDTHGWCREVDNFLKYVLESGTKELAITKKDDGKIFELHHKHYSVNQPSSWWSEESGLNLPFDVVKMRLMIMSGCDITQRSFSQVGPVTSIPRTTRFFQPIFLVGVDGKPVIHLLFS